MIICLEQLFPLSKHLFSLSLAPYFLLAYLLISLHWEMLAVSSPIVWVLTLAVMHNEASAVSAGKKCSGRFTGF